MKLATYRDGSRDGQLVVVSRDLTQAHFAHDIASRLQQVLDDWNFLAPQLQDLSTTLNHGKARHAFAFDPARCMAPLPRAPQWVQAGASSRLTALLRQAGLQAPPAPGVPAGVPWLEQGAGDDLLGPCDDVVLADPSWGLDYGAGLAVITGDLARGAAPAEALDSVRLLMLVNHWRLRESGAPAQPAASFGPVAVTPDELGEAWRAGRLRLTLESRLPTRSLPGRSGSERRGAASAPALLGGQTEAASAMGFHVGQLLARLALVRRLRAGSVVGTGPLGAAEAALGIQCLAELRARELLDQGHAVTPWLDHGDQVQIEMMGIDGQSVFGALAQTVVEP